MIPLLIVLALLQGCVTNVAEKENISRHEMLQSVLDNGGFFSQKGEHMSFYIPANKLFVPYTSQWQSNAHDYLIHTITNFISTYDVVEVNVTGKLFGAKSKRFLDAIARQQAKLVANNMDEYNLDVRVLNILGTNDSDDLPLKVKAIKNNKVIENYGYIKIDFRFNRKFF